MARQVLPWVGGAIGFVATGGTPMGFQAGFMIGSIVGNAVDPQVIKGPALGEGQNNSASEGDYRPIVLGKGAVGVCMIHEGPIKKRTIRTRQSKGGGPVTEEERAYRTMAFALGESAYPATGLALMRLWIDNKLRYDVTPTSQIAAESAEFADEFTFYPGNEDQLPDPDLEAFMGAGNVPAYKGGSPYIVFPDWDVTSSQGRAPMIKAELASVATNTFTGNWYALPGWTSSGDPNYRVIRTGGDHAADWSGSSIAYGGSELYYRMSADGNEVLLTNGTGQAAFFNGMEWIESFYGETSANPGESVKIGANWWICRGSNTPVVRGNGVSWMAPSDDIGSRIVDIRQHKTSLIGARILGGSGISRSTDSGANWEWVDVTTGLSNLKIETNQSTIVFVGISSGVIHIFYSINDGDSFAEASSPFTPSLEGDSGLEICWSDEIGVFIIADHKGQAAYSPTGWNDWVLCSLPDDAIILAMDASDDVIAAGCEDGRIIRTLDGITFTEAVVPNPPAAGITDIAYGAGGSEVVTGEKVPLYTIASFIHDRVDIPAAKINVSQLTDMVEGVVFADGYTGADAMRAAMGWYQFDAGEFDAGSGYRINYIKRGGAAEATLTDSDVVEGPEEWEREDSYERPRVLHIAYQNPIADYGAPVIPIKRTSHDVKVVGERSVAIPFVTSDQDEVARRGDVALTVIYTEIAGTVEVILPISWLALAPTNTIGYSIRDRVRRLRMTDWKFSPDGTIKTEWIADRQSAFTSQLTALPAVPTTPPPPSIAGPTVSAVLDIPALVDSLDTLHLYVAATGITEGWWGSVHQRRLPWDTDYTTAATFTRPATIIGSLTDVVTDASTHFTDTTNVVRVTLYQDDELETFTQQQFLSENGAFALSWEDSGTRRWEVMQYRDAVKVGDREWELTTLLRGRLNTEPAEHPVGSLLVILDSSVRAMPMQSAWIGEDITHRAVSNGQLPDQAVPYTEQYTGESQREWPVASIAAGLDGDALAVSYVPRHRFGTDMHPVRSANWSGYRVTATDGINTATVDTLADAHVFDVTGWGAPITVSVSQLNRITGAGPAVTEEVP